MKKSQAASGMEEMLKNISNQLVLLDRKIDILFSKASAQQSAQGAAPHAEHRPPMHQRPDRQYFKSVCADCKKECEVPFRPTGDRPVYCKECFSKRKASSAPAPFVKPQHHKAHVHKPKEKPFYAPMTEKRHSAERGASARKRAPVHRKRKSK